MALIPVVFLLSGSSESERKLQRITCINNLKQIGIAFRIWEGDHGDQYPFNVSTNAGGTWELCAADKDGFDGNAFLYLRTMTNELTVQRLMICPQDPSKKAATNWASLQAENISYRFRSGTNVSRPTLWKFSPSVRLTAMCFIATGMWKNGNGSKNLAAIFSYH
jgi:hypothetical protein